MGSIVSSLRSAGKTIGAVAKLLADLNRQYKALLVRVNAAPGLPYPNPSTSYWLKDPPYPELVDMKSEVLPGEADVVIIGSGITAAAVAKTLFSESISGGKGPRVVVLEARRMCEGATGRNGGHIKASPHEFFPRHKKRLGGEGAARLTRFLLRTAEAVLEVGGEEGREAAECRVVETVDFFLDQEGFEKVTKEVEDFKKWVPEFKIRALGAEDARREFGVGAHVVGALAYEAGALWPYRLVARLWRELLDDHGERLSLETGTGVEGIEEGEGGGFVVSTGRGKVKARHVVHATNAHASQFLPGLRGKMAGVKAHMTAQRPGDGFAWRDGKRSWSILYEGGGLFDYVSQRPNGDVMLGGGFGRSSGQGADMVGVYDDGCTEALTVTHVAGVMQAVFGEAWEGHVTRVWSGILGVTGDMAPFVGRVPGSVSGRGAKEVKRKAVKGKRVDDDDEDRWEGAAAGEWISAGYCGDGMVWAWLCGTALGIMISGKEDVALAKDAGFPGGRLEEWFPKEILITEARVSKADMSNLVDELV
ncbi:putative oxidoreductase OrdL 1 [Colletotrichum chlorophyti]|uniref:Putative oxidoreductase OrdL 1 n=1 Tax=Colletotrichum chlorophyti TaxID=708187 RepID=A0A1Q8RQP2_9PEZI|nr:putative oxidoreductase OrdL 1 [Colletotrichum chlorophyti]